MTTNQFQRVLAQRQRVFYTIFILIVIAVGLWSRSGTRLLSPFVAKVAGDMLWALLVFLLVRWLAPARPVAHAALIAAVFAGAIETSQLYHAPWIDAVRHTRLGVLVLGNTFLWSDLVCYLVGIAIGTISELLGSRIN